MSNIVLLNREGVVVRKLQLVSLRSDYVVPEGMMVSWRTDVTVSSRDPFVRMSGSNNPVEAFFYRGNTQGQVCRKGFNEKEYNRFNLPSSWILTVTVQGTSANDVMNLRDNIMHFIHSNTPWKVSNDLNPKPGPQPISEGFLNCLLHTVIARIFK